MSELAEVEALEQLLIIKRELALLSQGVAKLNRKADQIIMSQSDADALSQRIDADVQAEGASIGLLVSGVQELKDELAAAQQQNPGVDLSGISSKVDALDQQAAALANAAQSVPQPPAPPQG